MRHEGEHLRAGDSRVVTLGLLVAGLTPWNPVSWWQLRRLRTAVEIDCDARVLGHDGDVRAYGAALLTVAAGTMPHRRLAFAAFSESSTSLRARIVAMTSARTRAARVLGAVLVLAGVGLGVQACGIESPVAPTAPKVAQTSDAPVSRAITDTPSFTRFTKAPQLINRDEVVKALADNYPPLVRDAGVGGKADVWVRIGLSGVVERAEIHTSSGHQPLDLAALRVARVMRFKPAQDGDTPVPVWVSLPIAFVTDAQKAEQSAARAKELEEVKASGRFTPWKTPPQLDNREDVGKSLEANYPPLLRDAGVGGRAEVWVHIDDTGAVHEVDVKTGSGHEALDRAAVRVGQAMHFKPARGDAGPIPVWVAIPITFQVPKAGAQAPK
jgi:TonB family protein